MPFSRCAVMSATHKPNATSGAIGPALFLDAGAVRAPLKLTRPFV